MAPAREGVQKPTPSAAISAEVVRLLKAMTGRGPTKAKTHVHDDCVVVLMREGHTVSEGTMAEAGQQRTVAQSRVDVSEVNDSGSSTSSSRTPAGA